MPCEQEVFGMPAVHSEGRCSEQSGSTPPHPSCNFSVCSSLAKWQDRRLEKEGGSHSLKQMLLLFALFLMRSFSDADTHFLSPPPHPPPPPSWHRFCPQRRTSCCVSDSMLAPVLNSWRLGGNTIQTAVATLKPMSSRWVELGSVCLWDHELNGFLSDLLEKANRPYDEPKLQEYTQTILRMFDLNGDGKLCLSEMSRLLPVQENFLLKFQDGSGFIDENELDGLLKDLYEKHKKEMSIHQLTSYRKSIMNLSDGGKLYCKELEIVLCSEPLL
ncbi:calretinin isoform X3 [Rhineura floridana]|uniref:calretinin isoform X3 n=1 Tax=Rhineura floridana TaxID=261503 RepID=UPI002AC844ED|nr:calretinin isoform X3 [Rhineura floridana]